MQVLFMHDSGWKATQDYTIKGLNTIQASFLDVNNNIATLIVGSLNIQPTYSTNIHFDLCLPNPNTSHPQATNLTPQCH